MPAHRHNGGGEEVCIAAVLKQLPLLEIAEASHPTPSPSGCCAILPQLFAHLASSATYKSRGSWGLIRY